MKKTSMERFLKCVGMMCAAFLIFSGTVWAQDSYSRAPSDIRLGGNEPIVTPPSGGTISSFTQLPLDSDGWTDVAHIFQNPDYYQDSRIVYVSNSGNDSTAVIYTAGDSVVGNDPFQPAGNVQPFASLNTAYSYLRDGYPDIMLLRRGDTWNNNLPSWEKSGRSVIERMVLGAYGDISVDRPKTGQLRNGEDFSYVIFSDLELDENERSLNFEGNISHVLIEGILCPPGPTGGMVIQNPSGFGGVDYLALRRCVVAGRYRPSGSTGYVMGMYIDDSINLLLEENIFDDNGEDEFDVPSNTDLRCHNTYVMLGRGLGENHIWKYNISTRSSSHGIQAGNGGTIIGNLCIQNPIAIQTTREDSWYTGCSAEVRHNVVLHGTDISSDDRRGWGILITNADGQIIEENIVAENNNSGMPFGILARNDTRDGVGMSVNNVSIDNNIVYNWNGSNVIDGEQLSLIGPRISNVSITNNRFHANNSDLRIVQLSAVNDITESGNNSFYGTCPPSEQFYIGGTEYTLSGYKSVMNDSTSDSNQTVPSKAVGLLDYLTSVNETASFSSFYINLRAQRKGNWHEAYTAIPIINFVRDGFGFTPIIKD